MTDAPLSPEEIEAVLSAMREGGHPSYGDSRYRTGFFFRDGAVWTSDTQEDDVKESPSSEGALKKAMAGHPEDFRLFLRGEQARKARGR